MTHVLGVAASPFDEGEVLVDAVAHLRVPEPDPRARALELARGLPHRAEEAPEHGELPLLQRAEVLVACRRHHLHPRHLARDGREDRHALLQVRVHVQEAPAEAVE